MDKRFQKTTKCREKLNFVKWEPEIRLKNACLTLLIFGEAAFNGKIFLKKQGGKEQILREKKIYKKMKKDERKLFFFPKLIYTIDK